MCNTQICREENPGIDKKLISKASNILSSDKPDKNNTYYRRRKPEGPQRATGRFQCRHHHFLHAIGKQRVENTLNEEYQRPRQKQLTQYKSPDK